MDCPKCSKRLSNKTETIEIDGEFEVVITCSNCESKFSVFISQFDLEECYDDIAQEA